MSWYTDTASGVDLVAPWLWSCPGSQGMLSGPESFFKCDHPSMSQPALFEHVVARLEAVTII